MLPFHALYISADKMIWNPGWNLIELSQHWCLFFISDNSGPKLTPTDFLFCIFRFVFRRNPNLQNSRSLTADQEFEKRGGRSGGLRTERTLNGRTISGKRSKTSTLTPTGTSILDR